MDPAGPDSIWTTFPYTLWVYQHLFFVHILYNLALNKGFHITFKENKVLIPLEALDIIKE